MFEECGTIDRTEVVYGRDGRSRVSFQPTSMKQLLVVELAAELQCQVINDCCSMKTNQFLWCAGIWHCSL